MMSGFFDELDPAMIAEPILEWKRRMSGRQKMERRIRLWPGLARYWAILMRRFRPKRARRRRMSEVLRIPLRVVYYREEGEWVAHCLEFDLIGVGRSREEALDLLIEAVCLQIQASVEHNNPANLFTPADGKFHRMFFAGKDVVIGEIQLKKIHAANVQIERAETREYAGAEPVCV
jgi:predicted RNase H-like HicB family nuclease